MKRLCVAVSLTRQNILGHLQRARISGYACAAFCVSALLAVCAAQAETVPADDPDIPASVIQSLDAARAANPFWMPKFKKLSYTLKRQKPGPDGNAKVTSVEIDPQPHGLLRMKYFDGTRIDQVLSFAGLLMLKVETSGTEVITEETGGRVTGQTTHPIKEPTLFAWQVKLELPAELKPGAVFASGSRLVVKKSEKADYTDRDILPGEGWDCTVKERQDASTYLPTLTGKALSVECSKSVGLSDATTREALVYFEDLALFVNLGRRSSDGSPSTAIIDMKIER